MLSLLIAERCSINTCYHSKESVKNGLSYKKGAKLKLARLRCSKCRRKENLGPKSVVANTEIFCLVR